jgi:hypothetical protein
VDASSQIDWNAIPMVFSELGPSSGEVNTNPAIQAEILKLQTITDVPPTPILQSGIWCLDVLKPKPAFHVVKEAFA